MTIRAHWADVSEHNLRPVNSSYTRHWLAFRANDGTYRDSLFNQNLKISTDLKTLLGMFVYTVWPRSVGTSTWQETFNTLKSMLGNVHRPKLVIMMDVESWGRSDLNKDHSVGLEAMRKAIVEWLYSIRPARQKNILVRAWYHHMDERRVIGYGNRGDLQRLAGGATKVRWQNVIIADYTPGTNDPTTFLGWGVIGRQYTNGISGDTPHGNSPWTHCDMNRSSYSPTTTMPTKLGLGSLIYRIK